MSNISKLQKLYNELNRLKESGEDVVADIRAEINNLELLILKDEVFPKAMLELANQLSAFRCTVDSSFQFDGNGVIDYTFCKSGTMSLIREKLKGEYNPPKISKKDIDKRQKQTEISKREMIINSALKKIKVTFPDGRVVCDKKVLNTLLAVVEYAGVENVVALEIKGGIKKGQRLIDRYFDPRYGKAIKSLGNGWYINTCSDTQKKYRYIKRINDSLNLNLTIELV